MDSENSNLFTRCAQVIQELTDKLTIQRIIRALLMGTSFIMLYTAFEYRYDILDSVLSDIKSRNAPSLKITASGRDLQNLVDENKLVEFVLVSQVDVQHNTGVSKFVYPSSKNISTKEHLPFPVFNYDDENTQQMIAILNNEFICTKFDSVTYTGQFANLKNTAPYVCSMAIPPFYGRIVGILTIGLLKKPTQAEIDSLRLEASKLTIQIYVNDLVKGN